MAVESFYRGLFQRYYWLNHWPVEMNSTLRSPPFLRDEVPDSFLIMTYSFHWLAPIWNCLETQGTNNLTHKLTYGCREFSISGNAPNIEFHPTSWEIPRCLGTVSDFKNQVENERLLFMTSQFLPNVDICSCLASQDPVSYIISSAWNSHHPEPSIRFHS